MTPLHIRIMLHHYAIAEPYSKHDRYHATSIAVCQFHEELVENGMLEVDTNSPSNYSVTAKGKFYIEYLLSVPVPSTKFVIEFPLPF